MLVLLSYLPLLLLLGLFYRLIRLRVHNSLPFFFSYVSYAIAADSTRFLVHNSHRLYAVTYWATEAGYAVLGLLVLYEVLRISFRSMLSACGSTALQQRWLSTHGFWFGSVRRIGVGNRFSLPRLRELYGIAALDTYSRLKDAAITLYGLRRPNGVDDFLQAL